MRIQNNYPLPVGEIADRLLKIVNHRRDSIYKPPRALIDRCGGPEKWAIRSEENLQMEYDRWVRTLMSAPPRVRLMGELSFWIQTCEPDGPTRELAVMKEVLTVLVSSGFEAAFARLREIEVEYEGRPFALCLPDQLETSDPFWLDIEILEE